MIYTTLRSASPIRLVALIVGSLRSSNTSKGGPQVEVSDARSIDVNDPKSTFTAAGMWGTSERHVDKPKVEPIEPTSARTASLQGIGHADVA